MRKGCVLIALVQGTWPRTVVSLKAAKNQSICDRDSQQMLLAACEGAVIYPLVVVDVDGIKIRALLDTGAGSSMPYQATWKTTV